MDRRRFLRASAHMPLLMLLTGCGSGDDELLQEDNLVPVDQALDTSGEEVLHPGLDPEQLHSYTNHGTLDLQQLREEVNRPLQASVYLGDQPQVGVMVDFFDIDNHLLGTAFTDSNGLATVNGQKSRYFVLAQAHTSIGQLYGIKFINVLMNNSCVFVNILQTTLVQVINELLEKEINHNISISLANDYFQVPRHINILNIGHDDKNINQKKMYADYASSGLQLDLFVKNISDDMLRRLNDESIINNKYANHGLMGKHSPVIEDFLDIVQSNLEKAIPIPFVSDLAGYGFGKIVGMYFDFEKPDPFLEVTNRLANIDIKLTEIADLIKDLDFKSSTTKLSEKYNIFDNAITEKEKVDEFYKKNPSSSAINPHGAYYQSILEDISDKGSRGGYFTLMDASKLFFQCGNISDEGTGVVFKQADILKSSRFYSYNSYSLYKSLLEGFIGRHCQSIMVLGVSYIHKAYLIAEKRKIDQGLEKVELTPQEHEALKADLNLLIDLVKNTSQRIKDIMVEPLPDRFNIDHKNRLAWIGACNEITELSDIWPSGKEVTYYDQEVTETKCDGPKYNPCRLVTYYKGRKVMGRGDSNWHGPIVKNNMLNPDGPRSVSIEIFNQFNWRLPTAKEIEESFLKDARTIKKDVDVSATFNGFSKYSVDLDKDLMLFKDPSTGKDIFIGVDFRKAGGGIYGSNYLDMTHIDFKTTKVVASRKATTAYFSGREKNAITLFPVATLPVEVMNKYLPWEAIKDNSKRCALV